MIITGHSQVNIPGGKPPSQSTFDKLFGEHFVPFVVSLLIVFLFTLLTVLYIFTNNIPDKFFTLFSHAIMGLIGFFAGSNLKKPNVNN